MDLVQTASSLYQLPYHGLPQELLDTIITYALCTDGGIIFDSVFYVDWTKPWFRAKRNESRAASLLLANRQCHDTALRALYGQQTFIFDLSCREITDVLRSFSSEARHLIKYTYISSKAMHRDDEENANGYDNALVEFLIENMSLKRMDLWVPQDEEAHKRGADVIQEFDFHCWNLHALLLDEFMCGRLGGVRFVYAAMGKKGMYTSDPYRLFNVEWRLERWLFETLRLAEDPKGEELLIMHADHAQAKRKFAAAIAAVDDGVTDTCRVTFGEAGLALSLQMDVEEIAIDFSRAAGWNPKNCRQRSLLWRTQLRDECMEGDSFPPFYFLVFSTSTSFPQSSGPRLP